jgi:hypothetical protein
VVYAPDMDLRALLGRLMVGVILATPLACLEVGASVVPSRSEWVVAAVRLECPVGALGCPCTGGGSCDPGLVCDAGICMAYGDEPALAGDYDYAYAESPPSPTREVSRVSRSAGLSSKKSAKQSAKPSPGRGDRARAEPAPMSGPGFAGETRSVDTVTLEADDPGQAGPAPMTDPAAVRRQVIYTATLELAVYDRDAVILEAEALPERWGGWIEARYDYRITLRIPAERLFEAIAELSERGLVLGKTLRADDVTAEYIDLDARIRVLEQIVAQLELLLARATSVEQALAIRVELDRVRLELASARAQMRALAELIDFSTLTIDLRQRGPEQAATPSNDPFPWVDSLGAEVTAYR